MTASAAERTARASTFLFFALTGIGQVLPGTLLPLLAPRWGWNDSRSGLLFLLFFVGSSMGAVAARGTLGRMLGLAALSIALPASALYRTAGTQVFVAVSLFGFGLGLAMTSISLLQSRRRSTERLAELTRLNLVWAAGACSGPLLLLRTAAVFGLGTSLVLFATAVLASGAASCVLLWNEPVPASGTWQAWRHIRDLPIFFALTLPLVTGVEASVGGWLTTYAAREYHASRIIITAATALWAGLLLSRSLFSGRYASLASRRGLVPAFAALPVLGLLTLLGSHNSTCATLGAFTVGFGAGPLYPYLLSRLLDQGEAGNAGFLAAGAGSALLPFLTGQLSQQLHSLRLGLVVPLAAAGLLTLLLVLGRSPLVSRQR